MSLFFITKKTHAIWCRILEIIFGIQGQHGVSSKTDAKHEAQLPEIHEQLLYVVIPVHSAQTVLAEKLLPALGLRIGFNSLDGD